MCLSCFLQYLWLSRYFTTHMCLMIVIIQEFCPDSVINDRLLGVHDCHWGDCTKIWLWGEVLLAPHSCFMWCFATLFRSLSRAESVESYFLSKRDIVQNRKIHWQFWLKLRFKPIFNWIADPPHIAFRRMWWHMHLNLMSNILNNIHKLNKLYMLDISLVKWHNCRPKTSPGSMNTASLKALCCLEV